MRMKHFGMVFLFAMSIMATGCKREEAREMQPVKVKVMKMEPVESVGGSRFSGTVEESSGSVLSFPVAGTVRQIRVEAGQRVSKGELLAVLDEDILQNAYDAAAATLEHAEDAWRRMKQLYDSGSLPEIQWMEAQSRLKQAQSAERISKKNLADGKLYAPFAGVVSEKNVEVGHNVMPGVPVVKLVSISQVKVCISVPENEVSDVVIGLPVEVSVPALGGKCFSGKIVERGVSANSISRSYVVKALIDNPSGELMPGMICTLVFDRGNGDTMLVLPVNVMQIDEENRCFVWVNDKGKARKRFVETGLVEKLGVQIASGLVAGDEVIVEGWQKVSDGMDIVAGKE